MKPKMIIKLCIDFVMTVLLLLLMAYQIVGEKLHEWFGAGMLVLFIAHNILNIRWYANLFKGKYKPVRVLGDRSQLCCSGSDSVARLQRNRNVPSFICISPHKERNGTGKGDAPFRLILGFCPYESASGASLGHGHRNIS